MAAGSVNPSDPLEPLVPADEFALRPDLIHLNHAAVGPWPQRTVRAVAQFAADNGHRGSLGFRDWEQREDALRGSCRALINAPSADDIALVKSTSEGLSMVAFGVPWQPGDTVILPADEFPSNRIVWESLARLKVATLPVRLNGDPDPEAALIAAMDRAPQPRLLTVSSVQYGSGLRLDLARLGQACAEREVLFCVDGIQSVGALVTDVQRIQADFLVADGHKWMLAPEGLALFYCRAELRDLLRLYQYGWRMIEDAGAYDRKDWAPARTGRRFECGSPNNLGIHALHASLSLLHELGPERVERAVLARARRLVALIDAAPELELLSDPKRLAGIVTFRHREASNSALHTHLVDHGVLCAQRGGGVRLSPHCYVPPSQLERAIELACSTPDRPSR